MKRVQDTSKTSYKVFRGKYHSGLNHSVKLVGPKARRG